MHYLDQVIAVFLSIKQYVSAKIALSVLVTIYSFFFGIELAALMLALTALIAFDILTAIVAAYSTQEPIESRKVFKSALKFGIYLVLVSSAHLTDMAVFGMLPLEEGMIAFLAATELISILENAGKMGYATPKKLLNRLQEFRGV